MSIFLAVSLFFTSYFSLHPLVSASTGSFLGDYARRMKWEPQQLEEKIRWLLENRIDSNGDAKLSSYEMKSWMQRVYYDNLEKQTTEQFFACNKKKDNDLSLDEYLTCLHSRSDNPLQSEKDETRMIARWRRADDDGDGGLSLDEFGTFSAPREVHNQKMHGLLVAEYIEDRDADGDAHLSLSEMIEIEPDTNESTVRERFKAVDQNKDGLLSHPEVEEDMFPQPWTDDGGDEMDKEIAHILVDGDTDKDGMISYQEMVDNLHVFMGTQVLHKGTILHRSHDEL